MWAVPLTKNCVHKYKNGETHQFMCRECNNKKTRGYYKKNKERVREINYRSIAKYMQKQNARYLVGYQVKTGNIIKPDKCSRCGDGSGNIDGHHEDYTKPLEVVWLCRGCHADADRELKEKQHAT